MAKVNVNLSDNLVDLVAKINTLSSDVGDRTALSAGLEDSDLVGAINQIFNLVDSVGASFSAANDTSTTGTSFLQYDSDRTQFTFNEGRFSIINDSAGSPYHPFPGSGNIGITYDSSSGILRFFQPDAANPGTYVAGDGINITGNTISIPDDGITRAKLSSEVELIIYNSSGTALKTMYGAGN
jgi:hypothetical protein